MIRLNPATSINIPLNTPNNVKTIAHITDIRKYFCFDTGAALSVPVGTTTLGRIFNVLGEPVDEMGDVDHSKTLPIHRLAPSFVELDTQLSIFETGIKVVDVRLK